MYDTILVPTDGSDAARRAARHGVALARAFDATIHSLSVVDVTRAAGPFDAGGIAETYIENLEGDAQEAVSTVEGLVEGTDLVTATAEGSATEGILEYVDEQSIDLVVMGTHGRSGLRRLVLGSVTEGVVRRSPVPVVAVPAPDDPVEDADAGVDGYDTILVPTDGSECANLAVDHAIALATVFDATVHVLGVVDVGTLGAYEGLPSNVLYDQLTEIAEDATATVYRRATEAGLDAVTAVREGHPAGTILDYADSEGVDFAVMGTHGRSGVERFLLGSTTERVIRDVDVPLMAVRSPE